MDMLEHRLALCHAAAEQLTRYLQALPPDAWGHPSACAAWEVRDVVAHLTLGADLYASILGRGLQGDRTPLAGFPPAGTPTGAAFVAERAIAYRTSVGDQLLATFTGRQIHLQRLMASLTPQTWETPCHHPTAGLVPAHGLVTARLLELAMHAWDIWSRRDPARPLCAASIPFFLARLPGIVARSARPDTPLRAPIRYRFAVPGAVPSQYDLALDGEAVRLEPVGTTPADVACQCAPETFVLLLYGRLSPQVAVTSGRLVVEGMRDPRAPWGPWFTFG